MVIVSAIDAGCILASLSYIIKGLEGLQDLAAHHSTLPKYGYLVNNRVVELRGEHVAYSNAIFNIFDGKIPSHKSQWQAKEADYILKSKLGPITEGSGALSRLMILVTKLGILVQLDGTDAPWSRRLHDNSTGNTADWNESPRLPSLETVTTHNHPSFPAYLQHYRRLIYTILADSIADLTANIREENKRLMNLHQQHLEALGREVLHEQEFTQVYLGKIFQLLGTQSGFQCQCHTMHMALLRMDTVSRQSLRTLDIINNPTSDGMVFSMVFYNKDVANGRGEPPSWRWGNMTAQLSVYGSSPKAGSISSGKREEVPAGKKKIRFSAAAMARKPLQQLHRPTKELLDAPKVVQASAIDLCLHLCLSISGKGNAPSPSKHLPVHLESDGCQLMLRPASADPNQSTDWSSLVSFEEVLQSQPGSMSTEQKLRLALEVASSVLYLYYTPWLKQRWTSRDIYLIRRDIGDTIPEPLVARTLKTDGGIPSKKSHQPITPGIEPTIFALGLFLIEISYGAPWIYLRDLFSDPPSPDIDEQLGEHIRDLTASVAILDCANNETVPPQDRPFYGEGLSYCEAISNCIHCDFNRGSGSMDDENFRASVYTNIVCPLQFALEDFLHAQSFNLAKETGYSPRDGSPEASSSGEHPRLFDDQVVRSGMDDLADQWFKQYTDIVKPLFRDRPRASENRVKVALLDTGVDNFTSGHSAPQDNSGHGTAVTSLLLRIAPNADIYVGRVTQDGEAWDYTELCSAIRWAAFEKKVHIISLSLGFFRSVESLEPIRRAIVEAYAADVIIFAAAHNEGGNQPIAFPAGWDDVICVASTDGLGNTSPFTPIDLPPGKRLCALGEGILCSWPTFLSQDRLTADARKSGSSYATPIVAGIAAVILDYMWLGPDERSYYFKKLRTKRGMLTAMALVTRENNHKLLYVVPWRLFNRTRKDHIRTLILDALGFV